MKNIFLYIILFFLLCSQYVSGVNNAVVVGDKFNAFTVDSVVSIIIEKFKIYKDTIGEYKADLYMKGNLNIKKSNILLRYYPSTVKQKDGVSEYLAESFYKTQYTYPNLFDNKALASCGTTGGVKDISDGILTLMSSNIYSGDTKNQVSPFYSYTKEYYNYKIDSIVDTEGRFVYYVSFGPVFNNYTLVEGSVAISYPDWKIEKISYKKRNDNLDYVMTLSFENYGSSLESLLPKQAKINTVLYFLGNRVENDFVLYYNYLSVEARKKNGKEKRTKTIYDLTSSYYLKKDTSVYVELNEKEFERYRAKPLSETEKALYFVPVQATVEPIDSVDSVEVVSKKPFLNIDFLQRITDVLFESNAINSPQAGSFRFSPILYPALFEYALRGGFSYQQNINYNRYFKNNTSISFSPQIGYNSYYKEFYYRTPIRWEYNSLKNASIYLEFGNGNYVYPNDIAYKLGINLDSADYAKLNIKYYRGYYGRIEHSIELLNGLNVNAGIVLHNRKAVKQEDDEPIVDEDKIVESYISIAPRISISWTPGMYYYKTATRKINLYSKFPTFSLDYERSFSRFLGSNIKYEKIEFDLQHKILLNSVSTIFYRFGAGIFTEQKDRFFIDFNYFSQNNLPISWNDQMGGVFQLLDRWWYNSSRQYIRGNVTYEVPFFLSPYLRKWTQSVINERIYFGSLVMPNLYPYLELGYGIGTRYIDLGVFLNNINGSFSDFTGKITFHFDN